MILNAPSPYLDPNPTQVDIDDFEHAIIPAIREDAVEYLNNPDIMSSVGISNQDVENNTPKYKQAIENVVSNSIAGFRENEAFTLKTQTDIFQAMMQETETIKKEFSATELSTWDNSVQTVATALPVDAETGEPQKYILDNIKNNLKASGINWDEPKIISEYFRLKASTEPYTLAITIADNPDSKILLEAAGQDVFIPIMERALNIITSSKIDPVFRPGRKKGKRVVPASEIPKTSPERPIPQASATSIGQANLDARIREAALVGLDLREAKNERNIARSTELQKELEIIEAQIQSLMNEGYQLYDFYSEPTGTASLQDITLSLPGQMMSPDLTTVSDTATTPVDALPSPQFSEAENLSHIYINSPFLSNRSGLSFREILDDYYASGIESASDYIMDRFEDYIEEDLIR